MKPLKVRLSLALMAFIFTASAQENQFTTATDWNALLAQAKKENKMVFVDSYFVGCHPCKQMDDEVFPLPAVAKQMKENFVSVKIDFMTEDLGKELQIKYAVTGFPTFLLLNSDGQLVARFSGYTEADKFQKLLKNAIEQSAKGKGLKGFSASLNVGHADFYTAMFTERKPIDAEKLAAYLRGKDILQEINAMPLLMSRGLSQELSDLLLTNYIQLESLYGKEPIYSRRNEILASRIKMLIPVHNDSQFEKFLEQLKPLCAAADWPYVRLDVAEAYYYKQLKDRKAFFRYAARHANDDDNKVRYMAMYLYSTGVDDEEKKLFADWMRLVISENSTYEVLGTAARIMQQQNDQEKAKIYADWGVKKAKLINKSPKYFESVLNK